jgi:hypothetical protein
MSWKNFKKKRTWNDSVQRLQSFNYKQLELISRSLKAAANPLSMAPSTFGLTQKSPHMASLLFLSQRHFSSWAILAAGNALPLQNHSRLLQKSYRILIIGHVWIGLFVLVYLQARWDSFEELMETTYDILS